MTVSPSKKQTPTAPGLAVQPTRNGNGIYATCDFSAGDELYEITGDFITGNDDEEIEDSIRDNAFRYSEELYISPGGTLGDYQNHSCEPNAKVVKRIDGLFVVAHEHVRKGNEVLIDYSTITGSDDIWNMLCNCGSKVCRTSIGSFGRLPKALRERYKVQDMVPAYIHSS